MVEKIELDEKIGTKKRRGAYVRLDETLYDAEKRTLLFLSTRAITKKD